MIEEETKKVTVTEENIREVIQTILKHSNISDLDVYNDIFENRVSIFIFSFSNNSFSSIILFLLKLHNFTYYV